MNEKNVQWDDLRYFLAVAAEGGLSTAARAVQSSPATLSRRMLALEVALGRELFVRHDRGYGLTPDGQQLAAQLRGVEAQINTLTAPPDQNERPLVKVSAGTWTTLALFGHMAQLTGDPADIRLRFLLQEAELDIAHREVVIGFRNKRPTQSALAGRKLARVDFAPYASNGAPDLWIKVMSDTPSARWLDRTAGADAMVEVNAPRNSLDLALAGQGKALLPTFIGDAHAGLQRAGPIIAELSHDQWIVTHNDDRHLPHVRRAIDRMCRVMAAI